MDTPTKRDKKAIRKFLGHRQDIEQACVNRRGQVIARGIIPNRHLGWYVMYDDWREVMREIERSCATSGP